MTYRKPPRGLKGWLRHTRDTAEAVRSELTSVGVLGGIRAHLRSLGIAEDQLTDEQLATTICNLGRTVVAAGIPWELATAAMKVGCDIMRSTLTWEQLERAADEERATQMGRAAR